MQHNANSHNPSHFLIVLHFQQRHPFIHFCLNLHSSTHTHCFQRGKRGRDGYRVAGGATEEEKVKPVVL